MKIAVTGASGHLGISLCLELAGKGHTVRSLVHRTPLPLDDISQNSVVGDVMDKGSLMPLVDGVDAVVHSAAVISIRGSVRSGMLAPNDEGTMNILEAAAEAGVKRFVHVSSIHALEHRPYDTPLKESRPLALTDRMAYSRSKALAEKAVLEAAARGMDVVILNPSAFIGPPDYEPSLMGRFLILLSRSRIPTLIPGGYDWVDVRDVAQGVVSALEKGRSGQRYILSGRWASLKVLARLVADHTGCRLNQRMCPVWLATLGLPFLSLYSRLRNIVPLYTRDSLHTLKAGHRDISHRKAADELGYNPRPLEVTVRDTLTWFAEKKHLC